MTSEWRSRDGNVIWQRYDGKPVTWWWRFRWRLTGLRKRWGLESGVDVVRALMWGLLLVGLVQGISALCAPKDSVSSGSLRRSATSSAFPAPVPPPTGGSPPLESGSSEH